MGGSSVLRHVDRLFFLLFSFSPDPRPLEYYNNTTSSHMYDHCIYLFFLINLLSPCIIGGDASRKRMKYVLDCDALVTKWEMKNGK
jgi:hypothetical protein